MPAELRMSESIPPKTIVVLRTYGEWEQRLATCSHLLPPESTCRTGLRGGV
jgi:hypothetical protein